MADAKKAELMRKKTDEFRKEFNISKPDCVIQWYDCGLSTFNSGKLFVSQNFVCYKGSTSERMPYNKITDVLFEEGLSSKVTIKIDKKVLTFGSFGLKRGQARECFEFINYLRNNSVSYIDPEVIDAHIKQVQAAQDARGQQQTQMNRAKVDTEASDALLRSAIEADYLQNQAAETLQRQNEQINRIGAKIDGIENSLDRSEHLLRGIESARYYMFGSQKNKNAPAREQALKTRTASAQPGAPPPIELDILYKNKDDSVLQSILILDATSFSCIHPATGKLIDKGTQWKYDAIESIVMRARHEHMDIRFKGTGPVKERRVRLMCSYLQVLTNQLWSRSGGKVPVTFEQYVRKFDYKDNRVLVVPPSSREGGAITPGANQGGFNRPAPKTSTLLADSSVETRQDMDYVDNNLDQVLVLAKGMNQRGNEMVRQIDNSNQVLNSYNNRMDNINSRVQNQNARLDHQIDKY